MGRPTWRVAAVVAVLAMGLVRAEQQEAAPVNPDIPNLGKVYAPPAFIKRGLVVYYDTAGHVDDKPGPGGVSVYVVDYVDRKWVAGQWFSIAPTLLSVQVQWFCSPGSAGQFYLNPAMARDEMANPEKGVKVTAHTFLYEHEGGKVESIFTDEGLITGTRTDKWGARRIISVMQYKAHHMAARPDLPAEFPAVAKRNPVYVQLSVAYGRQVPISRSAIEFVKVEDGLAHFKITAQPVSGGIAMPALSSFTVGTSLSGPFYIHPATLSGARPGMVTLELPKVDFKSVVTAVDQGMVRIDHTLGGQTCSYTVYDVATGIVRQHVQNVAGTQLVLNLAQ